MQWSVVDFGIGSSSATPAGLIGEVLSSLPDEALMETEVESLRRQLKASCSWRTLSLRTAATTALYCKPQLLIHNPYCPSSRESDAPLTYLSLYGYIGTPHDCA